MKYIAITTWCTGVDWVHCDELAPLTRLVKPHRSWGFLKPMDLEPFDLPATYTALHMATIVRVVTPEDMAYINSGYEPKERVPMWLAPSGAIPIKLIV